MTRRKHALESPGEAEVNAAGSGDKPIMAKARATPGAMDPTEELWQKQGDDALLKEFGKKTVWREHEPVTFNKAKIKYTPDFMHVMEDGEVIFIEVKASRFGKSYGASRVRARLMANTFSMFGFYEALRSKGQWAITQIK